MDEQLVLVVNAEDDSLFSDFSKENPDFMIPVTHKSFSGSTPLSEFLVTVTPAFLSALSAFLIARIPKSKSDVRVKVGEKEVEIKNSRMTNQEVLDLIKQLKK